MLNKGDTYINWYNSLTKKQIIRKIKINIVKPYLIQKNITKFKLNHYIKDNLLFLLTLQYDVIDIFKKYNIPNEIQFEILSYC
jgi:hypothetical protein